MNKELLTYLKLVLAITIMLATCSAYANPDAPIAYFFAHGLGGNGNQKGYCSWNKIFLPDYPCYAYHGPEAVNGFDAKKVVLGQEDDIAALGEGLKAMNLDNGGKPFIGFGISKGAATWINAAAALQPSNLQALVLESPFADANEEAYEVGKQFGLGCITFGESTAVLAVKNMHPRYNPKGPQPIKSIREIPIIPLILIHSEEDELIHVNHSRKLYRELIKDGRTNVHLVEVPSGRHAQIFVDNTRKGQLSYLKPLHAFYKAYNLPYDPELADNVTLKNYQPSLEEITEKIESVEKTETFYRRIKLCCAAVIAGITAYAYNGYNPTADESTGT